MTLIDNFSTLIAKHHKTLKNFQIVGSTLEATSKIYGLRVDSVHMDIIRMSSGLGRYKSKSLNKLQYVCSKCIRTSVQWKNKKRKMLPLHLFALSLDKDYGYQNKNQFVCSIYKCIANWLVVVVVVVTIDKFIGIISLSQSVFIIFQRFNQA